MENARGYAFAALSQTWERMYGWDWFAAMNRTGMLPTKWEYMDEGLRMYDALVLDFEPQAAALEVTKQMQRSLRAQATGRLSFRRGEPVGVKYKTLGQLPDGQYVDPGFERVEMRDLVDRLLVKLQDVLSPQCSRMLNVYVELGGDPSNGELAAALGVSRQAVAKTWERVRQQADGLQTLVDL